LTVIDFDNIQTIEACNAKFINTLAHDMGQALSLCEKSLALAEETGYTKGILDSLFNRAWYHILKCEFDQVFPLLKDLPEKYESIDDRKGRLKAINALGVMHLDMGNYDHALPYFLKCLTLSRSLNEREREASALANIGLLYNELDKIEEAFDYSSNALKIHEINNTGFYTASKCIGLYYIKCDEYDKAEEYLDQAEKRTKENLDTHFESEILTTKGSLNKAKGNIRKAKSYYRESLCVSQELGNVKIETENLYEIGCLYLIENQIDKAFNYLRKALVLAIEKDLGYFLCQCYFKLSTIYEQKNDYSSALDYLKKYNTAEKEYNLLKTELKLKSMGFEHELEKKQQQAEIYRLKNIELEEANRQIMNLANHDNLTGLANRRLFMEHFKASVFTAQRNKRKIAVLFIDLDDFKPVNDRFGHRAGDLVLKEVGERLIHILRKSDVVARFGGDEFVILVPELEDTGDIHNIAQKIIELFEQDFLVGTHRCNLGSSIGISLYPDDDKDIEELLIKADKAMYTAKLSGKNTFVFYQALPSF